MADTFFRNHEITIYRHRRKGSANRYGFSATFTGYDADIQPSSTSRQEMIPGKFGATYDAFIAATIDVKEGDRLKTENGKVYEVKGIAELSGAGLLDHKELLITSLDSPDE